MNDLANYIAPALTAITVPLVLSWLLRSAGSQAKMKAGVAWLEYGAAMKGFALFFVAIVAGLCVVWFNVATKDKRAVLSLILLFGGLTFPLVIEFFLVRIGFDRERIYCHSGWRKKRAIDWIEVESFRFSPSMQWWVIRTNKRGKIRASVYLSGVREFIGELQTRGIQSA